MIYILDFCGTCGVLLPKELIAGCCDNCGVNIMEREARVQGEFEETEAKRLAFVTNGDELE